jgi:hypothetical protein
VRPAALRRHRLAKGTMMAITCPNCSRQFDVTLFQFGKPVRCDCGALIDPLRWWLGPDVEAEREREERALGEMRRLVDRVCFYIVCTDYAAVDVKIEAAGAKRRCEELFPGKSHLFDMIYGSRFRRLWSQFRGGKLDEP